MKREKIRMLVLEDNPDDLLLLKEAMALSMEIDVDIVHAERLEEAVAAGAKGGFDVAVLDLNLPDSFGLETFVAFNDRCPHLPAIVLTGDADREMAFEAVKKGAQDYLFKGEISSTAIVRTIRYAIERHRLTMALKRALEEIKTLRGIIPICSHCKKIRDDKGYWNRLEAFIEKHSEASFSHSLCPGCIETLYGEEDWYREGKEDESDQ